MKELPLKIPGDVNGVEFGVLSVLAIATIYFGLLANDILDLAYPATKLLALQQLLV